MPLGTVWQRVRVGSEVLNLLLDFVSAEVDGVPPVPQEMPRQKRNHLQRRGRMLRPDTTTFVRAPGSRDVVFTFFMESWKNAVGREMYMTGPRLLATLMSEPSVRRLLVANPYRSAPIQWARKLIGQHTPFPPDISQTLVEPMRIRRFDPTSVRAIERVYRDYDRVLEAAAAKLGADRPTVITTNPLVAGFSPLRWAGPVTFYAWDDWRQRSRYGNGGRRTTRRSPGYESPDAPWSGCRRLSSTVFSQQERRPLFPTEWRPRNGENQAPLRRGLRTFVLREYYTLGQ